MKSLERKSFLLGCTQSVPPVQVNRATSESSF